MIRFIKGDATDPQASGNKVIAHICNDVGGWGKGFVLSLSKKWDEPEKAYRQWYLTRNNPATLNDDQFELGSVAFINIKSRRDIVVANMIAQHGLGSHNGKPPIRYIALDTCLKTVADFAMQYNYSVHMPRIGCGLAGGKWSEVEKLIEQRLPTVEVYVYDLGNGEK